MHCLIPSQKNMYDTHSFFGGTGVCNVGGCVFFKGRPDAALIKKSINLLLKNADGLRVRIKLENFEPFQYIEDYAPQEIETLCLKESDYKAALEKSMGEPFDICGKLYCFKIVDVGGKIGVYIKLHHVVSDAWSLALVASKLSEYYSALKSEEEPADDMPSYLDFVQSEKEYLQSAKFRKDEEFWQSKYSHKPALASMAPNKERSFDASAGRSTFVIDAAQAKAINDYCGANALSLSVLFEAVACVYAAKINGTDEITLCSMVINRNGYDEKNTVGMFNCILPLTVPVDGEESFLSLCKKISGEHFQMFRHQKYPLENILKLASADGGAIYDIMVSYQNAKINADEISSTEWIFNGTSDLGFMINISDLGQNGEIRIDFDWRKSCFTADTVSKIYARLMHIIFQAVANTEITVDAVDIVTVAERKEILHTFNNTDKEYPRDRCLTRYLEENAVLNPDKTALIYEGKELTYGDFNRRVNSLAHCIAEKVNCRNAIIGVMCERSFEMLVSIYAVLKAGHAYMPIDPHFPAERIDFMLEDSGAPLVLTQTKWLELLKNHNSILDVAAFEYDGFSCENLPTCPSPEDTAYVIYTSGSTGKPKGAMIAHHSAINRIKWMHEKYPLVCGDVILQKTPYTFDVSVWELFWWSMYNGSLKIMIPEGHKDPREIIKAVHSGKVTHMHFVPSMLNAFLEYLEVNTCLIGELSSLKYVFVSGEALQTEHVKKFYALMGAGGATLHNLYGPTECTVDVSYYDCFAEDTAPSVPIGKPIDNTQLLILDKHGGLLPVGIVGELYISGVNVGKGYLNRPELTAEKYVANKYYPYPTMYKTGDLAAWRADGNIEYCGRTDFQVKIRGLRVELGDIENAILSFGSINQAIVTAADIGTEKSLCAYYTASSETDVSKLKACLCEKLPEYMVPQYFVELDAMPVTDNGKINRKALPVPRVKRYDEHEYQAPETELERLLQEYAQKALEIDRVSCDVSLFEYGLSSLGVIMVITDLSFAGHELKVSDFYEHKTIRAIAAAQSISQAEDDYEEDRRLYSDISDLDLYSVPQKQANAVLITGATGFLGVHIISELYKSTDKTLFCLVRNEEKLRHCLEKYTAVPYPNSRIVCVKGDITKDALGIDGAIVDEIRKNTADVIHCAADVSFFCSWEQSREINYLGTCNALNFAKQSGAKLHHISTMSVSGDILTRQTVEYPRFTENDLYIGQLYKENVYAHSKYLAEKEVIKAVRGGEVNASIYRVANLTWRASDGAFQENYKKNDLFIITSVMKKFKKLPLEIMEENISLTPVDDCARAVVTLMKANENGVYNLFSKNSMSIGEYMTALDDAVPTPMHDFYSLLQNETDIQSQFVLMYIAGILDDAGKSVVRIINDETNKKLCELGYEWQTLGDKYVRMFESIGG